MATIERPFFCYYVQNNILYFRHDNLNGAEPLNLKQETKEQAVQRLTAQLGLINPVLEDLIPTPGTTEKDTI